MLANLPKYLTFKRQNTQFGLRIAFVYILIGFCIFCPGLRAQNHTAKWYFGQYAALDFMSNPPSMLANSTLSAQNNCASVADASGNLLFYTNGQQINNAAHLPMANGTGLMSLQATAQCLIVKQPGSQNLYYVITNLINAPIGENFYSIVDMSLAAGMGSVTTQNVLLAGNNLSGKMTATRHCNGRDVWLVFRELSNNFRSYLLTPTGINTLSVVNSVASGAAGHGGQMKISPNGQKLAVAEMAGRFELYDFDNSTGVISNSLSLLFPTPARGVEFSPDGTKLYGSTPMSNGNSYIYQWDLCAGSATAIAASMYSVAALMGQSHYQLQLAKNGKIYGASLGASNLTEIASPNVAGAGCNFTTVGPSLSPNLSSSGLPNFINSDFLYHPFPGPFTYSITPFTSCQTASFTAPPAPVTATGCAVSYSLLSMAWNFGDPASGAANTSTINNPVHTFSGPGTYSTELIFYYTCGGGSDTIRQTLTIQGPSLSIATSSITCANLGSATITATGGLPPITFTWLPVNQTGSVATGLIPGTYSVNVSTGGGSCVLTTTANFAPLVPLSGSLSATQSLACNGDSNGSAILLNLSGGSAAQNYTWTNGPLSYNSTSVSTLFAGTWSMTVSDALTACQINSVFTITQPAPLSMTLTASSPSVCAGSSIALSGTVSGGTAGYTYTWTNGPVAATQTVTSPVGGYASYTLNSTDANGCLTATSIPLSFVNNPVLSLSTISICPQQIGTLTVTGAGSYTWTDGSTGSTFTDNPLQTSTYSVIGAALGCTTSATASIVLKTVPVPGILSNSPLCQSTTLNLSGSGGVAYLWQGPPTFTSALQNPSINPVQLSNAGVYNLTVTAANACTASASTTITVYPTPSLTALGSTLCTGQTISLSASSEPGATYAWTGPLSFTSSQQSLSLASASLSQSGQYSVVATSTDNCNNTTAVTVSIVSPPNLLVSLSSNSFCAQALSGSPNTITLTANGANSYTLSTPNHIYNPNPTGPNSPLSMSPPYLNTGPATATLTGSNGVCTASITSTFSVVPNPTLSALSPSPVICAGQSFTYTSNGANSYTWSASTPGAFTYTSGDIAVASPSVNSVFSVAGGSLGCYSAQQSSTLSVNPLPLIAVNGNTIICPNTQAVLTASGTSTAYVWSPAIALSATTGISVNASPAQMQTYTVTGTLNNCNSTAAITVSVLPLPSASFSASAYELCLYDKINLQGSGGQNYLWQIPGGTYLSGQQVEYSAANINQSGTFSLTVTDTRGCKNTTTANIKIRNLPNGTVSGPLNGCAPWCAHLSLKGDPNLSGQWSFNQQNLNGPVFDYCFEHPGTYTVTNRLYDAATTCSAVKVYELTVYPKPKAEFDYNPLQPTESMDEVTFMSNSQGNTEFNWYLGTPDRYQSSASTANYTFKEPGQWPMALVVKNEWGCADTVVKVVQVEPFFNLYVPNAFSPNGDNLNEVFYPVGSGIADYHLLIFDRWGEKVFESHSLELGWDGTFRGEPAKTDTYSWRIRFSNSSGKVKDLDGHVSLLR